MHQLYHSGLGPENILRKCPALLFHCCNLFYYSAFKIYPNDAEMLYLFHIKSYTATQEHNNEE